MDFVTEMFYQHQESSGDMAPLLKGAEYREAEEYLTAMLEAVTDEALSAEIRQEAPVMMYPFLTLEDETEITHSETQKDGSVKVYIETPDEKDGFHDATCFLPEHRWTDVHGYSDEELERFKQIIRNNAHLIMEFSQKGGVLNAANF